MKRFIKVAIVLFLIYSALSFVIGLIGSIEIEETDYYEDEIAEELRCDEYTWADTLDTDIKLTHFRSWIKYDFDSAYCLSYSLLGKETYPSYQFRNDLESYGDSYEVYWRNVYYELINHDSGAINFLKDSLERVALKDSLSKNELARLIVSFVQDIPYNYVMPGPCDRDDHPCRGNEKYGVLSPIEFLYSLNGDCDTRSVLLYALLKHFGIDPIIMISNEYAHAMIAVDVPGSGDHIIYKGKKFYFWETTNTGWLPGMLPPGVNNLAYWRVTLDHEHQAFTPRYR